MSVCLCLPMGGVTHTAVHGFSMGSWDPNSGPHAVHFRDISAILSPGLHVLEAFSGLSLSEPISGQRTKLLRGQRTAPIGQERQTWSGRGCHVAEPLLLTVLAYARLWLHTVRAHSGCTRVLVPRHSRVYYTRQKGPCPDPGLQLLFYR